MKRRTRKLLKILVDTSLVLILFATLWGVMWGWSFACTEYIAVRDKPVNMSIATNP